jgi:hypothetical protein
VQSSILLRFLAPVFGFSLALCASELPWSRPALAWNVRKFIGDDKLKGGPVVGLTGRASPAGDCSKSHEHVSIIGQQGVSLYPAAREADAARVEPGIKMSFCKFFLNLLAFIFRTTSLSLVSMNGRLFKYW